MTPLPSLWNAVHHSMDLLITASPFIAFTLLSWLVSARLALWSGFALALLNAIRGARRRGELRVLDAGVVLLFAGLALYASVSGTRWTLLGVNLAIDAGLFAIMLGSLVIGKPFTLQYARERVDPELWNSPLFLSVNRVITLVWALAFAVVCAADILAVYFPSVPLPLDLLLVGLAIAAAAQFTSWYPAHRRAAIQAPDRAK
jgi:hypothetical protein